MLWYRASRKGPGHQHSLRCLNPTYRWESILSMRLGLLPGISFLNACGPERKMLEIINYMPLADHRPHACQVETREKKWPMEGGWGKGQRAKGKGEVIRPKSLSDAKECLRNRSGTFWGGVLGLLASHLEFGKRTGQSRARLS